MPYNPPPGGASPGFGPHPSHEPDRRTAQNGVGSHRTPDSAIDSQQQLNVFFPSGDDGELESVLKPLLDGSYTGSQGNGIPDHSAFNRLTRQPDAGSMPTPSSTPGMGPFPVGNDLDGSAATLPPPSSDGAAERFRSIQPLNYSTSPLPAPGTLPVAVAKPAGTGGMAGPGISGYGVTYNSGSLNPYISPQLVQSLVTRILSGIPTNAVLERSPDIEQMLAGRFMSALSQIPGPVPANSQPVLFKLVVDEILGWGPLEPLLQDNTVTQIMVNGASQVWVERDGRMVSTEVTFLNEGHLLNTARRMAARMGQRLDRKWPMINGRLPNGSRVNIVGPPCALHGTSITICKLAGVPLKVPQLVEYETITQELADFLRVCVLGKLNMVVAGGPSSGKTTLLNALASFIPEDERIVTVEESAELKLEQRHVVALETRAPDYDSQSGMPASGNGGEVTIRHLVANALRMRAERVLVGEIRDGEVLDLVSAMNTGHDGVLATMRASTPRDAVAHLESMALMSGTNLAARSVREAIATGIDVIVQIARLRNGTRRVIYVTEVRGMEGDRVALQDIFRWHELVDDESGASTGFLEPTGHTPRFIYRLQDRGLKIDRSLFSA